MSRAFKQKIQRFQREIVRHHMNTLMDPMQIDKSLKSLTFPAFQLVSVSSSIPPTTTVTTTRSKWEPTQQTQIRDACEHRGWHVSSGLHPTVPDTSCRRRRRRHNHSLFPPASSANPPASLVSTHFHNQQIPFLFPSKNPKISPFSYRLFFFQIARRKFGEK